MRNEARKEWIIVAFEQEESDMKKMVYKFGKSQ